MVDYGRDLNIGRPVETTLKDIRDKLSEVEKKIDNTIATIDESNLELRKVSIGTGLLVGVDLDEEVD